jgi:flagellum-specific peptidoglycan hydrolase FlgJ
LRHQVNFKTNLIMNEVIKLIRLKLRIWWEAQIRQLKHYLNVNKYRIAALVILVYIATKHDFNVEFGGFSLTKNKPAERTEKLDMSGVIAEIVSSVGKVEPAIKAPKAIQMSNKSKPDDLGKPDVGNTYSNVSFWSGKSNKKQERRARQEEYIRRFSKIAQTEMEKFGIPASIILAQGILESNAGNSRLAMQNNNHFGVKCFSHNCQKGHCSNFTDDSHKDFFRVYQSPWESYRAHSVMIKTKHYRVLLRYGTRDYKNWAYGLKKLGYATDKHYAESLLHTIEDLNLDKFDK